MKTVVVLLFLIGGFLLGSSLSLSSSLSKNAKNIPKTPLFHDRRAALATALPTTLLLLTLATAPNLALALTANPPLPQGITTVVLDSPESKIGVQLYDVQIGSETYPAVKSVVSANGEAALQGVQEGMIVLSSSSSKAVVQRIQSGPYPLLFQFYNLAEEMTSTSTSGASMSAAQGLKVAQQAAAAKMNIAEPQLSSKGTGLVTKTVRKGATTTNCDRQARRGDTVTIAYEARVASPGGPIYDSSDGRGSPVTFVVGDGKAISGVNIGIGGMCQGDVRELDIPSGLGYGGMGSRTFDIPGDIRLWWRIELLQIDR